MSGDGDPTFLPVPERFSFPRNEEEVQAFWDRIDAFKESMRRAEGRPVWNFYDGPPFATGLPHYGHILAGTIKDIVCRYAHQTGHFVSRRAGWDCHGLPVEFEIDQRLGIKSREDVLAMGIDKYNEECRSIVMRYSTEWVATVTRMGRWIDFENDYKTMNVEFMESVWWVFKTIYDKGLVYKGFKVMPYSTGCTTPLANFEVAQNYKEVSDPAVVVGFPLLDDPDGAMLCAWTTTPWTLPSNLALCVHPEFTYVKVRDLASGRVYVLLQSRLSVVYKEAMVKKAGKPLHEVLGEPIKGSDLKGRQYTPPFPYFAAHRDKGCFRVLTDTFVKDDSGTGIVHMAPAFGEDDNRICREAGIVTKNEGIVCPVDANGNFTEEVTDFAGQYIKDADKHIMANLKERGLLVEKDNITHQYPFCWRSDTPLIYRTIPSWFVNVERVKDQLLANNELSRWVPDFVKSKRFRNWLLDARDWAVSRNRFWGTPIPVWASEDGEEVVVVGSIEELRELSGVQDITDLHRHFIDHITIPSRQGKGELRRIEEVFDCWFESGSMPYAQVHYPFENKDNFEATFPADFIAEGLDQTRGWFYTLLVLATCLFDKPAFKNLIVNGLVLAEDGRKMSKRLKNYPDPVYVIKEYGADALRLYLINSPVVCAETLRFREAGVKGILKDVMLPWYNAYRFFVQSVERVEADEGAGAFKPDQERALRSTNTLDRWILATASSLVAFVRQEMEAYRLYTTVPRILEFMEDLTNWYIKLNRARLQRKADTSSLDDCLTALATLYEVLLILTKLMAPLTPFFSEHLYQGLARALPPGEREESIHFCMVPMPVAEARDEDMERRFAAMKPVIELGRTLRRQIKDKHGLGNKTPLPEVTLVHRDRQFLADVEAVQAYVLDELNIRALKIVHFDDAEHLVYLKALPNHRRLGTRFGKTYGEWQTKIRDMGHRELCTALANKSFAIDGETFDEEDVLVQCQVRDDLGDLEGAPDDSKEVVLLFNVVPDQQMLDEAIMREAINRVQRLRKETGLQIQDDVDIFYRVLEPEPAKANGGPAPAPAAKGKGKGDAKAKGDDGKEAKKTVTEEERHARVLDAYHAQMSKHIGRPFLPASNMAAGAVVLAKGVREVNDVQIEITVTRSTPAVVPGAFKDETKANHVQQILAATEPTAFKQAVAQAGGKFKVRVDGEDLDLVEGTHFVIHKVAS